MAFDWLFWPKAAINPAATLDLTDERGRTDHAKVVPFFVLVTAFVAHFIGNPIPLWHLIVLFSASFGYSSWRTFLKARMAMLSEQRLTAVIRKERDPAEGIDPA